MTNPSTPLLKMWEIALPTPLRIDAPVRQIVFYDSSVCSFAKLSATLAHCSKWLECQSSRFFHCLSTPWIGFFSYQNSWRNFGGLWRSQEFSCVGSCSPRIWGRKSPLGSRGQAPVWGPPEGSWTSLQTLFTDFNCRNDQNSKAWN